MHPSDSLNTLYCETEESLTQFEQAKEQLAAYKKERIALRTKYQAYFDEMRALDEKYQPEALKKSSVSSPSYRNSVLTVCELAKRLCRYHQALPEEEQAELEAALEGYDIAFCAPEEQYIDFLYVFHRPESGYSVRHYIDEGDFVVLETELPIQELFAIMRMLLPADFFSLPEK